MNEPLPTLTDDVTEDEAVPADEQVGVLDQTSRLVVHQRRLVTRRNRPLADALVPMVRQAAAIPIRCGTEERDSDKPGRKSTAVLWRHF